uniref:Portal protein n=1 Tax=Siphoviridae sp. cthGz5 TaxID=2825613 RepID=A0A8S5VA52_9CAUD|nr:MAG TPA: portal protein [Siphoviridae sp. cthGz5]
MDERALRHKDGRVKLPEGKQRLYRGLNLEQNQGELYKEYSPAMRDEAYIRGLEKNYRNIEFIVGLAYGDLSDASEVDKTATEIRASKQRKYNRVNAIQENLRDCLSDFVDALAFYSELYTTKYEFSCAFNDSILTDEESEREQDRKDVAMGVMGLAEYRAKWYQEDEDTAAANLPEQPSTVLP